LACCSPFQSPEEYFETANRRLFLEPEALFADELLIGVPDGTDLNRMMAVRERLYACCEVFEAS